MSSKPVVLINHLGEPKNKTTGISNYLFSLLAALLERGTFSYVLVTNWDAGELPAPLKRPDLPVETLNLPESIPRNIFQQMLLFPGLMRRYQGALEFNANPVGCFARRWPRVITVHDVYFDLNPARYKIHHVLWWRLFFPLSRKAARRIICVSGQTQTDLIRFHQSSAAKTVVVHEAASLAPAVPGHSETLRKPYGLFVANVSPNKGGDALVAAMNVLERGNTPIEILHVGRDDAGVLKKAQTKLGMQTGPRSLGKIDLDALMDLYAHASFLVFPSTAEGFGLPILEAHAFGVPVIATDIPVLREVAGEGALYFDLGDVTMLARHMNALMTQPALWERMHEAALRNAALFSWEKAAAETEAVFRQAMAD